MIIKYKIHQNPRLRRERWPPQNWAPLCGCDLRSGTARYQWIRNFMFTYVYNIYIYIYITLCKAGLAAASSCMAWTAKLKDSATTTSRRKPIIPQPQKEAAKMPTHRARPPCPFSLCVEQSWFGYRRARGWHCARSCDSCDLSAKGSQTEKDHGRKRDVTENVACRYVQV